MKRIFAYIILLLFCKSNFCSAQKCNFSKLIHTCQDNWKNLVGNPDSIFIIKGRIKFTIRSKRDKQKAIALLINASWASLMSSPGENIRIARLDTLYGRTFKLFLPETNSFIIKNETYINTQVYYNTKKAIKDFYKKRVVLGDKYCEIFFKIGNDVIISPAIYSKRKCKIFDNILCNSILPE